MSRLVLLTLFNLMLPFLVHVLYLAFKRWWVRRHNKKNEVQKELPDWSYPWKIFFIIAFALTLIMIFVDRFFFFEPHENFEHVIPKSAVKYK